MKKKKISFFTPCFNEEDNIVEMYNSVMKNFSQKKYDYEYIWIDNCSSDNSQIELRKLAQKDKNVKVIINYRNFGHIRSPYHGLLQTTGDASITLSADFQDPPNLIPRFINEWEKGSKIVLGVKSSTNEGFFISNLRKLYYIIIDKLSEVPQIRGATGFGLYDKKIISYLKLFDDPYPYFRGLISEIGVPIKKIQFSKPKRRAGISKSRFSTLYDLAMLGIINHSLIPLKTLTLFGLFLSVASVFVILFYLIIKLCYWNTFEIGIAPLIIGQFFFGGVIMFSLGLIGEYIGRIHTNIKKHPHVFEKERINFDKSYKTK